MLFVLTGPESSGKTSLANYLAEQLNWPLVTECARAYLSSRSGYQPSDLLRIAALQQDAEQVPRPAIADTDLQVLRVWWQVRFGPLPPSLIRASQQLDDRFYLLCAPDLPWQADPLRENPTDRDRLFQLYENDLTRRRLPYGVVSGVDEQRRRSALEMVLAQLP